MKKNYREAPISHFHKTIYICSVLGQIACGYALGIAGTAVTQAQSVIQLNTFWVGLLGAGTLIGLSGSLFLGNLADKMGRSKLLLMDMTLFTIFSILHLFVSSAIGILLVRICIGLCIAIEYSVGSTIISEWINGKKAAKYLSNFVIYWTLGYVISFVCGLVMKNLNVDYHIMFASSAIFGGVACALRFIHGMPESPSWMASIGNEVGANTLVEKKLGSEYCVVIETKVETEKVSVGELFSKDYRNNTIVGGVFYACQVFPYFGVGIFLPILMSKMNMGSGYTGDIIYDVFCMVGAFVGVWLVSKMSRRKFLTSTFFGSALCLIIMIIGQNISIYITIVAFAAYAMLMSIAVVLEWPYPPELFDDRTRATGVGIVIAFSRIGAFLGTFLLPILVESIGATGSLIVCASVLIVGGIVCQIMAPETSPEFMHKNEIEGGTTYELYEANSSIKG